MRRKYEIIAAIVCLITILGIIYYQFTLRKANDISSAIRIVYQYPTSKFDDNSYNDYDDHDDEGNLK